MSPNSPPGISRARDRVELWAKKEVVGTAISRRIQRMSGLRHALWGTAGLNIERWDMV
jgi:hypothetical protein